MSDDTTIRVLIADDQRLMRAGFRLMIDAEPGLEVVGEAADGIDAVRQVGLLRPDVVLMDIRMPEMDGLEATREIVAAPALADVRILVLTTFDLDEYVYEALRSGASGFLLKDTDPDDLLDAIRVDRAGIVVRYVGLDEPSEVSGLRFIDTDPMLVLSSDRRPASGAITDLDGSLCGVPASVVRLGSASNPC